MIQPKKQSDLKFVAAFFQLVRFPNLLIIILAQFLIRIMVIGPREEWLSIITDYQFLLLCLVTTMIAAAGYIINDYYDIKVDIVNNPNRVVVGKVYTRRIALLTHFVINVIAVLLSLFLGWKIFATVFVSGFLMWFYSNQLKRLALWGNITISLLTGISIYYLTFLNSNNERLVLIYAIFGFMISLIREIVKDIEDMKGDEQYGCKTLPIVWGVKKTKLFIFGFSSVFVILMVFLFEMRYSLPMAVYFGVVLFPMFIFLLVKLNKAITEKEFHFLSQWTKIIMIVGLGSAFLI